MKRWTTATRRLSSGGLTWKKDRERWTSLLPSCKKTADLTTIEEALGRNQIKYCLPAYVDMHGIPKTKLVPVDHVVSMCEGSELFTGAALDGVPQDVSDNEVCAVADPALGGFPLPWQPDVAWFPASLYLDGAPFEPCSRNIFARAAERAKKSQLLMKLGIEAEFFVFRQDHNPVSELPNLEKPCYDQCSSLFFLFLETDKKIFFGFFCIFSGDFFSDDSQQQTNKQPTPLISSRPQVTTPVSLPCPRYQILRNPRTMQCGSWITSRGSTTS